MSPGRHPEPSEPPGERPGPGRGLALPRGVRLTGRGAFGPVFDGGRRFVGRSMVLWFLPDPSSVGFRFGVVASRRSLPGAVQRNRAKRLMREVFRLNRDQLRGGGRLVMVARTVIAGMSLRDVAGDFFRVARAAGLLALGTVCKPSVAEGSRPGSAASRSGTGAS